MDNDGGRWDVGAQGNAVYVARIAEDDKQLFDDVVAPDEARKLAGLLTKYADKADEAVDSDDADADGDSDDSEDSDDSGDSEDTDESSD